MSEYLKLERVTGSPANLPPSDLASLAELYARVFAGEPWHEYTVCPSSGSFFGKTTMPGERCQESGCMAQLEAAYPHEQTMAYISNELSQDAAALWLLQDSEYGNDIVGFTWGFAYDSPESFARAKYKTPEMQVAVHGLLQSLDLGRNGLWYLSESGIEDSPRYRGKGWSREFHDKRLEVAHSLGLCAVQRTSAWGNMYRTSRRTMTQIMGIETMAQGSGQLQPTGAIINGVDDTEVYGRVLFAKNN